MRIHMEARRGKTQVKRLLTGGAAAQRFPCVIRPPGSSTVSRARESPGREVEVADFAESRLASDATEVEIGAYSAAAQRSYGGMVAIFLLQCRSVTRIRQRAVPYVDGPSHPVTDSRLVKGMGGFCRGK